ncbi:MAG: right-handed parallel beta-helix repeat-containing protein [Chloroflexota bacterium]|nr:right-handed parallel beta-helix repeat-containing protein [Chloroflexota bacterium]
MNKTIHRITGILLTFVILLGNHISAQASPARPSALSAVGSVYYVSTTGNDSNAGTSSAPFKTFAKATSMLSAGSTLYIQPGTYNEPLKVLNSGADGAWITVKPSGGAVIIDVQNTTNAVVQLLGSYIAVSDLEVKGSTDICVKALGSYLRIASLNIHECQTHGIFVSGMHVEVTGNTIYAAALANQARTMITAWGSGIKIGLGGDDVMVNSNTVYHNYGEGLAVTRASNVIVRGNTVYDNYSVNIYVDNSFSTLVEKNLVTCHPNSGFERNGNPASGIAMGEEFYEGWGAQLHHVTITNNIVAFCRHGVYYYGADPSLTGGGLKNSTIAYNTLWGSTDTALGIMYSNAQAGTLISSNIIWQANNRLAYAENATGLTFQNNLWKALPTSNVRGIGDRVGDPLFLSTPGYVAQGYALGSLSPAIAGGANIGVTMDYFNNPRGPSYDIGAFQNTSVIPTVTALSATNTSTPPPASITPTQIISATGTPSTAPTTTSTLAPTSLPPTTTATISASTPVSTASPAPTLETIYNDTHPGFVYSTNWQNVNHNKAYAGSYKLTTMTGSSVTLNFTGRSFSLLYTTGLNFGMLDIYVDNQLIATLNQKTSQIYFQKRWDSAQLSAGAHVLKLVFTGRNDSKGTLDAVIVR